MKLRDLVISILAVTSINSCTSYYYVVTDVERDLSVVRTVHMENEDYLSDFISKDVWSGPEDNPSFEVDFYDQVSLMKKKYRSRAEDISRLSFQPDHSQVGNPLFTPMENVSIRFRWFYTYYDYQARFKSLNDMLPLDMDGYITQEQRKLFFRGGDPPQGWNGLEMYYVLDDLTKRFAQWYSDAVFYTLRDIMRPYCTRMQADMLDGCKDDFIRDMDRDMLLVMEPDSFVERLEEIYPDAGFDRVYSANQQSLKDEYEKASRLMSYFGYSFVYSIDMPGRYYDGNALNFIGENPSWKVDAFRLLDGDLVLEAVYRKMNVWAFMLTFALIILVLQIFAKVFSRI